MGAPAPGRSLFVTTAEQAAALDRSVIDAGTPARLLMQQAASAATGVLIRDFGPALRGGVSVYAGSGNNGGDGWDVARLLADRGVSVRVHAVAPPATPDAIAARESAIASHEFDDPTGSEAVVVDAVLGTGATGAVRGSAADAVAAIRQARDAGATVVALDLPSGLDATTGDGGGVVADATITFGTVKRGLLARRELCGRIYMVDIGLHDDKLPADVPILVDERWVTDRLVPIPPDAHKGTRGKVAIVGGSVGMAGAAILATRAATASGIGMVRAVVATESRVPLHAAEPVATVGTWPLSAEERSHLAAWADACAIGPGLGTTSEACATLESLVALGKPTVLDADALNLLATKGVLVGARTILTPHRGEAARILASTAVAPLDAIAEVSADPYAAAARLSASYACTVLLKGVPTIVAQGPRLLVVPRGTPALATAGAGDLLTGIIGALLAQGYEPLVAGGIAAWIHGRAAELAGEGHPLRGVTLSRIAACLSDAWPTRVRAEPPVLAVLPAIPA